jgi:hypothetical protein
MMNSPYPIEEARLRQLAAGAPPSAEELRALQDSAELRAELEWLRMLRADLPLTLPEVELAPADELEALAYGMPAVAAAPSPAHDRSVYWWAGLALMAAGLTLLLVGVVYPVFGDSLRRLVEEVTWAPLLYTLLGSGLGILMLFGWLDATLRRRAATKSP